MKNKRLLKLGAYSVTLSAIVLAVVIALNLIVSQLPSNFLRPDLTPEKLTTFGDETKEILKGVKDDITFYYIVSEGNEDPNIRGLAERYADECENITLEYIDPTKNPTFINQYTTATLTENSIIAVSEKRNDIINGADFYQNEIVGYEGTYYSDSEFEQVKQQYAYYMQQEPESNRYFFGENELTGAVDFVTGDTIPVMYCLTGHGEVDISQTAFGGLISDENIELKSLTLASGETIAVPEDAGAVIINAPSSDLGEAEADALISYLDDGGKVILMTFFQTASEETIPNLLRVCDHMGLESKPDIIADNDEDHYYQYPYNILPTITGNGFSSLMDDTEILLYLPYSHAIEITGTNADVETYSILQTSGSGYICTEETLQNPEAAEKNTFSLCYQSVNKQDGSLIWAGSPYLMDDSFIRSGNAYLTLAALQSIFEKSSSVSIIGKSMDSSFLEVPESGVTTWTMIFVIVIVAVLAVGITVFVIRRKK